MPRSLRGPPRQIPRSTAGSAALDSARHCGARTSGGLALTLPVLALLDRARRLPHGLACLLAARFHGLEHSAIALAQALARGFHDFRLRLEDRARHAHALFDNLADTRGLDRGASPP